MSNEPTIIYTLTDEAPALATAAFLPVVRAFAKPAGVRVDLAALDPAVDDTQRSRFVSLRLTVAKSFSCNSGAAPRVSTAARIMGLCSTCSPAVTLALGSAPIAANQRRMVLILPAVLMFTWIQCLKPESVWSQVESPDCVKSETPSHGRHGILALDNT